MINLGYSINRTKYGIVVNGNSIPASDMKHITSIAKESGYDVIDIGIAASLKAFSVYTTEENAEKWRAEIEEGLTKNGDSIEAWLKGTDVGSSSKVLAMTLAGISTHTIDLYNQKAHPYDPSDIGRCFRMLDRFPHLRDNLFLMNKVSPVWKKLVGRWDELRSLYDEEYPSGSAPKLYDLIQELIK